MKDLKSFFCGWDFCAGMTTPINKYNISQACNKIYSYIGLSFPNIVFVESPIKASSVYYKLKKTFSVYAQLIALIGNAREELSNGLDEKIINIFWNENIHNYEHIFNFTPDSIKFNIPYLFGNQDRKIMYLDFLLKNKYNDKDEISLIKSKLRIDGFFEMLGCHWWIPMDSVVICVDRPINISYNKLGYHCSNDPAIVYRDNVKVYAKNGVVSKIEHGCKKTKEYKTELILNVGFWKSRIGLNITAYQAELITNNNQYKLKIRSGDIVKFIRTTKSYQIVNSRAKIGENYRTKMHIPLKINVSWHNGSPKIDSIKYSSYKEPAFIDGLLTNSDWLL